MEIKNAIYEGLEFEFFVFDNEDVITESGPDCGFTDTGPYIET